jgi:hypothetical protein
MRIAIEKPTFCEEDDAPGHCVYKKTLGALLDPTDQRDPDRLISGTAL